jgi:glycerol-3-phosphate O-acyltransferase / dihydroxyacetone phosphate acyltransferase
MISQSWLDERLFGWSKSSKRGTSAWAAHSRSADGSRLPTPETSDDEDGGDYDNVLGYLSDGHATPVTPRSRAGSYADLQKLRMSKVSGPTLTVPQYAPKPKDTQSNELSTSPISTSPTGSLRARHGRKGSLVDGVPVERINQCDKQQPFEEMTEDLNRETGK